MYPKYFFTSYIVSVRSYMLPRPPDSLSSWLHLKAHLRKSLKSIATSTMQTQSNRLVAKMVTLNINSCTSKNLFNKVTHV